MNTVDSSMISPHTLVWDQEDADRQLTESLNGLMTYYQTGNGRSYSANVAGRHMEQQPKVAQEAFSRYEGTECHIVYNDSESTTTITTKAVGYNYVEFSLEITGKPVDVGDGTVIMGSALDLEEEMLVYSRRTVFVKDTPPEIKLRSLKAGDHIHVVGIPRIDLALVSWRVQKSHSDPTVLHWNLPYEIIVVAVYEG